MEYFVYYLMAINIVGALFVVFDKRAAHRHEWRVRESTFFIVSILGGSIGVYLFMRLYRHKTLHKRFMIGIPLIFMAEIAIFIYIFSKFKGAII